jgi:perosamine synthetase
MKRTPKESWRIPLARPDIGAEEISAIRDVLESGVLTNGNHTARFEEAFASRHNVDHAIAVANGTLGLTAMFIASGIGSGDEVIVPSMSFISSATSVLHVGATPVFADIDSTTFNIDPTSAESSITPRTKAILAVHYGGQPADMDELAVVSDDAGILLFEDAAEAHGATYRRRSVGALGRAAMFSFTPTKNITTGEGGIVTTNDVDLARKLRLLRNHGQLSPYQHVEVGFNWRMTEMQAAMGVVQVTKLDEILDRKSHNARWMRARLQDVPRIVPPAELPDRRHVYMLYTMLVDERDRVLRELHAAGIEARVYFPPIHKQPIFSGPGIELPVTEEVGSRILSIPFHSRLEVEELEEIALTLERATSGASRPKGDGRQLVGR